jgi:hypothetical protein
MGDTCKRCGRSLYAIEQVSGECHNADLCDRRQQQAYERDTETAQEQVERETIARVVKWLRFIDSNQGSDELADAIERGDWRDP